MRRTAVPWRPGMLVAGLVLVVAVAGGSFARAADEQAPWLGVYSQELTPELRDAIGFDGDQGVLVSRVVSDSPAEKAGLEKGDVILSVGSRRVESPSDLQDAIGEKQAGDFVTLNVFRDGERRTLTAQLGERPETMETPAPPAAPRAPRAPRAPEAPNAPMQPRVFEWNGEGDLSGLPGLDGDMRRLMSPARGRLGVRIESLSPELGDYFSVPDGKGVLVLEVMKDTPAARAGLRTGDVITRVDDRPVADSQDLVSALRGKEGRVTLRVVRKGAGRTIEATLERSEMGGLGEGRERIEVGPGTRRVIRLRDQGSSDLRAEVDQLKRQIEELQKRLDQQEKSGRD